MAPEQAAGAPLAPRKEWFTLASPLGVIGAFAALVEVAMIIGVIFAVVDIRWAMPALAVVLYFTTAGVFFWILVKKNWGLYPRREFGTPDVGDLVGRAAAVEARLQRQGGGHGKAERGCGRLGHAGHLLARAGRPPLPLPGRRPAVTRRLNNPG